MEVRYDKREGVVTLCVKTVGVGRGRPECVPEMVGYSRGERESL